MQSILYLHGLFSTGESHKSQLLKAWIKANGLNVEVHTPTLSVNPYLAVKQLQEMMLANWYDAVIGSSMGGFHAAWIGQEMRIPTVLINPLAHVDKYLKSYIGELHNPQTDEKQEFTQAHLDSLRAIEVKSKMPQPQLILCYLKTHDETLDFRDAAKHYAETHLRIREGGDHGYADIADEFPEIASHLSLT